MPRRQDLPTAPAVPGAKLFLVKAHLENPAANDAESLGELWRLFPTGDLQLYRSAVPGHDFWIFTVD